MAGKAKGRAPPPPPIGKGKGNEVAGQNTNGRVTAIVQQALTGDEITVEARLGDLIECFKIELERHFNLPPLCQKIMTENGIICQDGYRLSRYCPKGTPTVRFIMVLTDSDASHYCQSDDSSLRFEAAVAYSKLALQQSGETLTSLLQLVGDRDSYVRTQAARGLAHAARAGDTRAIYALGECMGPEFQDDLNAATAATDELSYLASEGNEAAWTVLSNCLDNPTSEVARHAVKVLAITAILYNNARALSLLKTCLEHRSSLMRQAAVAGVAFAAYPGEAQSIALLVARLNDEDLDVKNHAIAGLGKAAEIGDCDVKARLLSLLLHSRESRSSILIALSKIGQRGDREVLAAVQKVVEDPESPHFALSACANLANSGDEAVIVALLSRVQDPDSQVRSVAMLAILSLVPQEDERIMFSLISALKDSSIDVRLAAAHGLAHVAHRGNLEALALLGKLRHDAEPRVRSAAEKLAILLEKIDAGEPRAKRVLQHALEMFWRRWSVDASICLAAQA